jgi:hypothetical protein
MQVRSLKPGQVFVEIDELEWAAMSNKERARTARATFERVLDLCHTSPERIHVRTSRGDWCIPEQAPVTVVYVQSPRAKQEAA